MSKFKLVVSMFAVCLPFLHKFYCVLTMPSDNEDFMKIDKNKQFQLLNLTFLLSAFFSVPAYAQETSTTQEEELFEKGVKQYMAGKYQDAALSFRQAYEKKSEATFLYNVAKALQKLENYDQALIYAKRARDQKENPLPPELLAKLPGFITQLEAQKTEKDARALQLEKEREAQEGLTLIGWTGIGLATVGAGLAGWSFVVANDVKDLKDSASGVRDFERYQTLKEDSESKQTQAQVLLFSGIGLGVAGAGLLVFDLFREREVSGGEGISWMFTPSTQGAHVGIQGAW